MGCLTNFKENKVRYRKWLPCTKDKKITCYWIGGIGIVWGGVALVFDWYEAFKPKYPCDPCLDYTWNKGMSFASAILYTGYWINSFLLIYGVKKGIKRFLRIWMVWAFFFLLMQFGWCIALLPIMPTTRGVTSAITLVFVMNFFSDVKAQYKKFKHLEEPIVEEYVENDDELPQVVCLKPGDISQEEYDKLRTEENIADASSEKLVVQGPQLEEEVPDPNDGKILFRKPAKRSSEDGERVRDGKKKHRNTEGKRNRDGKRHKSSEEKKDGEEKKHKEKRREKRKKELLSFNQEEEDENE